MNTVRLAETVCPGIVHPQVRYKELLGHLLRPGVRWLDLGCGHEVIRPWALRPGEVESTFAEGPALSVGVDRDVAALHSNICTPLRVAADIQSLPFADGSFEVVTANMVLEHSENPAALMAEVWRVLRPKGIFVFHTPNKYYPMSLFAAALPDKVKSRIVALVSHRQEDDVYPTFYRINTQSAISHYADTAGFRIKYSELMESLSFNRHRVIFLAYLALAWLLRRKTLGRLKPDFQVMLCKPDVECACKRLGG
jgi:ubiquinone/menaquinone biosynthesis C-methylase UbiE